MTQKIWSDSFTLFIKKGLSTVMKNSQTPSLSMSVLYFMYDPKEILGTNSDCTVNNKFKYVKD